MNTDRLSYLVSAYLVLASCSGDAGAPGDAPQAGEDPTAANYEPADGERTDLTTVAEEDRIQGTLLTRFRVGNNSVDIWELDTGGYFVTEAFPHEGGTVFSHRKDENLAEVYLRLTGARELPAALVESMDRQNAWTPERFDSHAAEDSSEVEPESGGGLDASRARHHGADSDLGPDSDGTIGTVRQNLTDAYFKQKFCEGLENTTDDWCLPVAFQGAFARKNTHKLAAVACGRPGSATLDVTFAGSVFVPRLDCRSLYYHHKHERSFNWSLVDWSSAVKTTLRARITSAENSVQFAGYFKDNDERVYAPEDSGWHWDL